MSDLLVIPADVQDLLFAQARTANAFTDQPVSDEQVQAIYELTKFGPTALNSQPLRVVLVRSDDARARLLTHMSGGNHDKTASAPLTAILAADTNFHEQLPTVFPHWPEAKDVFAEEARRVSEARFGAAMQLAYFIVGVRAAGLAAGPMTGYDAAGLDADLLAGTGYQSIAVVNIGHPAENSWFDRLPRLAHDEVVTSI